MRLLFTIDRELVAPPRPFVCDKVLKTAGWLAHRVFALIIESGWGEMKQTMMSLLNSKRGSRRLECPRRDSSRTQWFSHVWFHVNRECSIRWYVWRWQLICACVLYALCVPIFPALQLSLLCRLYVRLDRKEVCHFFLCAVVAWGFHTSMINVRDIILYVIYLICVRCICIHTECKVFLPFHQGMVSHVHIYSVFALLHMCNVYVFYIWYMHVAFLFALSPIQITTCSGVDCE